MNKYFTILLFLVAFSISAQPSKVVSQEKMNALYQEIKTPYKYGLVLTPSIIL
jgi:endonuclease III